MTTPKRSKRMQLIVELARKQEEAALKQFLNSKQALEHDHQRLKDIQQYYLEYSSGASGTGQTVHPEQYLQTRQFLAKLDAALDQQKQQIKLSEQRVEIDTRTWQQLRLKTQSLVSYQQRCREQEQSVADKAEQKLMDELSTRKRTR